MRDPGPASDDRYDAVDRAIALLSEPASRVRGGGGVVYRRGPEGAPEILLVHRPAYDDWTPPKGKCSAGEHPEMTALREVHEETGLVCLLERFIDTVAYVDHRGRDKVVWYWLMRPVRGQFAVSPEVDQVRWLTPAAALRHLSHEYDRELMQRAIFLIPDIP